MPTMAFPNRCRHCDPAPCLAVCPTGAITRDDDHGLVLVEPRRCIGCAMCAVVCPFDAVTFHPLAGGPGTRDRGGGEVRRLRRPGRPGDDPACVEVCKVDALVFGELNELVAAGRLRETGAVLAAAGATAHQAARRRSPGRLARLGRGPAGGGRRRGPTWSDRRRSTTTAATDPRQATETREDGHEHTNGNGKARRLTVNEDAQAMIDVARREGIETVWDRLDAQQPQCGYCALGLSCRNCAMGPVPHRPVRRGSPEGRVRGRRRRHRGPEPRVGPSPPGRRPTPTTAGTSSRRSRRWPGARPPGYEIADEAKLRRLAAEVGVPTEGRDAQEVAVDAGRRPARRLRDAPGDALLRRPGARRRAGPSGPRLGITPRGIDRENVEMLHRTHMGVDNDYVNTLLHGLRTGLSDGWGGSMIATELSDVMFGTPTPVMSEVNLGVLRTDQVNIAMHGHNPMLSDVVVAAAEDPELVELARSLGATGINVVGLCCTGNELLMRRGVPMAGNHLMQELVLITGALEAMVVDYQCIMPSIVDVAKCYHTKIISTSDKAKFTGATHVSFDPEHGAEIAHRIVRMAVEAYPNRNHERVRIPDEPRTDDGRLLGGGDPRRPRRHAPATGRRHRLRERSVGRWPWSAATTPSSPRTSSTSS